MSRRLPRTVQLTVGKRLPPADAKPPLVWELRLRGDGRLRFLAEGDAASRAEAREQAWRALEEAGLVIDE